MIDKKISSDAYTFDDVPSTLALATVPAFATRWSGMAAVYLETNGLSTIDDPSGNVLVDVPPLFRSVTVLPCHFHAADFCVWRGRQSPSRRSRASPARKPIRRGRYG